MAPQKRKLGRFRVRRRRAQWVAEIKAPTLGLCPRCHKRKPSHQVCPHCGYYRGEFIKAPASAAAEEK